MSAAVTIIFAIINKYKRKFRQAGAIYPGASIIPSEHGVPDSRIFRKLVRDGIFIHIGNGRYYMDETKEAELQAQKQKLVWVLIVLVIIGLFIGLVLAK